MYTLVRVILDMAQPPEALALATIACQLQVCIGCVSADVEVRMVRYPSIRCHTLRSARQRRAPLHTPRAGRSLPAQLRVHAQGCQCDDAMRSRCRDNSLRGEGGAALAGGLTALTGLQTLDLRYGAMGGWCGVWPCAEGGYGCALALARRRCLTVDALLW